jgi:CBS domain-containing protein
MVVMGTGTALRSEGVLTMSREDRADPPTLTVRRIIGQPLVSRAGERLGQVRDVVIRLAEKEDPPVVGLVVHIAQRAVFVPLAEGIFLPTQALRLVGDRLDVRSFERRPREIVVGGDLLGHHVINIAAARLIRVRDVELAYRQQTLRAVGVMVDTASLFERLLQGRSEGHGRIVLPWSGIEPLLGHVPTARWRLPFGRLARLHPARLADLVEMASPSEGEEIIRTVGQDRALEADVFEELEPAYQIAHVRTRSDAEVADLLATMAPDDAADLLLQLEGERRERVLGRLPLVTLRKVRPLLGYNPATAGGLMSTEYLTVAADTPIGQLLESVRASELSPGMSEAIYVIDHDRRLVGVLSFPNLLRRDPTELAGMVAARVPISVSPEADIPQIALSMTDFNLTALPVVDAATHLIGVIAVDDLLEVLLPEEWRTLVHQTSPATSDQPVPAASEEGLPPA